MSNVDTAMRHAFATYVLKMSVDSHTKIDYDGADYSLEIKLSEGKWVFVVEPKLDYGELAMKKVFEKHTTEELSKG